MIKLFAIDMDGTLLNSNSDISEKNIEAIKELNQAGIKTVLTSGRVSSSVDYFNEKIGIDNPMVANNGAVIKLSKDEVLATHPLDDDELINLIEFCDENEFSFNFYDSNTFYTNRLILERLNHLKIHSDYVMNYQCDIYVSSNPYKELKRRKNMANKLLISGLDSHPYGQEKAVKIIEDRFLDDLYVTSSGFGFIEIMHKNVDKWSSILELAAFLGINSNEIATIGDSYNDLPMIESSEISFAMGNANESIKKAASHVVLDNDSDGFINAKDIIINYNKENPSV